jgi:hypothetical protein
MTTIQINERTKAGKALIETARVMAEKFKGIKFINEDDAEDQELLKRMVEGRTGFVSEARVMKKLNRIIKK